MDMRDIERFINRDRVCRTTFQGVFSSDTLPRNPRLLICNTDPSSEPGQHWIAIYVDEYGGQWRRYLWGTGARAPPLKFAEKKFGARIKKICLKQRDGMGLYNLIINYKIIIWTGSDLGLSVHSFLNLH
jgi:hypothetical protein